MKRRPVRPVAKASGANTDVSVSVIATTAKPISFAPWIAACRRGMPSSMWRKMFSSITIASSTTRPIASTIASSVKRVDREPERIHQPERADQRDRDGDDRNQGGAQAAEEEIDDEHDQQDRLDDGAEHRLDRAVDEHRRVVGDRELHPRRQARVDLLDFGAHRVGQVQRVGNRLLDDADVERRLAVEARDRALVHRSDRRRPDIAQAHGIAADVGDDDAVELLGRVEVGLGDDGELARLRLDATGRDLGILAADRVLDVLHGELVAGEP